MFVLWLRRRGKSHREGEISHFFEISHLPLLPWSYWRPSALLRCGASSLGDKGTYISRPKEEVTVLHLCLIGWEIPFFLLVPGRPAATRIILLMIMSSYWIWQGVLGNCYLSGAKEQNPWSVIYQGPKNNKKKRSRTTDYHWQNVFICYGFYTDIAKNPVFEIHCDCIT